MGGGGAGSQGSGGPAAGPWRPVPGGTTGGVDHGRKGVGIGRRAEEAGDGAGRSLGVMPAASRGDGREGRMQDGRAAGTDSPPPGAGEGVVGEQAASPYHTRAVGYLRVLGRALHAIASYNLKSLAVNVVTPTRLI